MLTADPHRVYLEVHDFGRIHLRDFLAGLASKVQKRPATLVEYQRIRSRPQTQQPAKPDAKLKRTEIFCRVQALVNADTTLIAETGDSWFNGMALKLPGGTRFEIEMQWGSIGWAVPGYIRLRGWRIERSHYHFDRGRVISAHRHPAEATGNHISHQQSRIEVEIHDGPTTTSRIGIMPGSPGF